MSRLIDAEFEENHYASMLLNPTPDVTEQDKHNAKIIISALRTAKTVEPKTGKWIKISPANIYECSECGKNVMTNDICAYDFCHGCGAKMEGGAE